MIFSEPPQFRQCSTSISNTRLAQLGPAQPHRAVVRTVRLTHRTRLRMNLEEARSQWHWRGQQGPAGWRQLRWSAAKVIGANYTSNPANAVPRLKFQKPPPDSFSREEADKIIAKMTASFPAQVANLVAIWLWTGLRKSEVDGLRWKNVNLECATLNVREAQVRGARKLSTKINAARTVKLHGLAFAALKRQITFTAGQGGAVFHDPRSDEPWNEERAFRRSFRTPTLKNLGIRCRRPYNLGTRTRRSR